MKRWLQRSRSAPLFPFVCVFVFALSIKLLSPCLTTSNARCAVFILFHFSVVFFFFLTEMHAFAHVHEFESQRYAFCGRTEGGGGLCYQFILCGLGYKKHPVLWLWKKSLSLIFGKPIKVCRSFHTGCGIENKCYILSPFPFELANYRVVKIKISL